MRLGADKTATSVAIPKGTRPVFGAGGVGEKKRNAGQVAVSPVRGRKKLEGITVGTWKGEEEREVTAPF